MCGCVYVDISYKQRRLYVLYYIVNNVLYVVSVVMVLMMMMLYGILPYTVVQEGTLRDFPSMKLTSRWLLSLLLIKITF